MNDEDILHYRMDEVEKRMGRVEKFILTVLVGGFCFSGTLLWLMLDLPNRIASNVKIEGK